MPITMYIDDETTWDKKAPTTATLAVSVRRRGGSGTRRRGSPVPAAAPAPPAESGAMLLGFSVLWCALTAASTVTAFLAVLAATSSEALVAVMCADALFGAWAAIYVLSGHTLLPHAVDLANLAEAIFGVLATQLTWLSVPLLLVLLRLEGGGGAVQTAALLRSLVAVMAVVYVTALLLLLLLLRYCCARVLRYCYHSSLLPLCC